MKKGRHRRFEEARALKRGGDFDPDRVTISDPLGAPTPTEPCEECGAAPEAPHASWCRATEEDPYDGYAGEDSA